MAVVDDKNAAEKAHEYEQAVLAYEKLDREVDDLLSSRGGQSENLSDEEFAHYRELAELRDLAYNKVKTLEQELLDD
jgi:hypothetical protein